MNPAARPLSIAILGTRGIPARYGGFETFAEELSARLVARGHSVTVYARPRYAVPGVRTHRGVRVIVRPTISTKHLDTVVHAFVTSIDAAFRRFDVALYCNAATAPFVPIVRLFSRRTRVVLNVDGIERRRRKWGPLGRLWYAIGERAAASFPHAIVADAREIARYWRERHGMDAPFIAYGAPTERAGGTEAIRRLGLEAGGYVLYVSRLEPENHALAVVRAFRRVKTDKRLVVVGDAPYARGYVARVKAEAAGDPRIVFPGAIYGEPYREILSHAALHVHGTEVGGTHPALLEAMGVGHAVLVLDTPENREAGGDAVEYFALEPEDELAGRLAALLAGGERAAALGARALARVREHYDWERVADAYETLFRPALARPAQPSYTGERKPPGRSR